MCLIESTSFILAATFIPHLQEKRNPSFGQWQRKSQLFFLDSNQVRVKLMQIKCIYANRAKLKIIFVCTLLYIVFCVGIAHIGARI